MSDKIISELDKCIENINNQYINNRICTEEAIDRKVCYETAIDIVKKYSSNEINKIWIPCSERLPMEESIRVYVTLEHNESGYKHVRRMLYFFGRFENSNGSSVSKEFKVIAWTPDRMPQPYKGE